MSVLAYQPAGTYELKSVPIPAGYEQWIDDVISRDKGIKLTKSNLDLAPEEILGVFSEDEFKVFHKAFFSKDIGKQSFLELGQALKERRSLDKWKRHAVS